MILRKLRQEAKGQSLVEFTLVLPFLLLFVVGLVEVGAALFDYMQLANANREGVRLAARGRFSDNEVVHRIEVAGGLRPSGNVKYNLDTHDNLGVIITHIPIPQDPGPGWWNNLAITRYVSGTIATGVADPPTRPIADSDSRITTLQEFLSSAEITTEINALRVAQGYEPHNDELVVVETFVSHQLLLNYPGILPIPNPVPLYFQSVMRVTLNSRVGQ